MPPSVSVFGAAGFAGALAARLLYRHPWFELQALTARGDVGVRLDELYPYHRVPMTLEELDLDRHAEIDAAVVAYPHGAAAPLARAGLIEDLVIDAKSGVSGAGRAATAKTHFSTVDENLNAYGVPRHRHTPEIEQELAALGSDVQITFTPHLIPLDQGELVSCYATLCDEEGLDDARALYQDAYSNEPFVELTDSLPGVRDVRETNICRVSVHRDPRTGRVIAFGALDNLWKGAASQAIQNLNLMFGRPEGEGIK